LKIIKQDSYNSISLKNEKSPLYSDHDKDLNEKASKKKELKKGLLYHFSSKSGFSLIRIKSATIKISKKKDQGTAVDVSK